MSQCVNWRGRGQIKVQASDWQLTDGSKPPSFCRDLYRSIGLLFFTVFTFIWLSNPISHSQDLTQSEPNLLIMRVPLMKTISWFEIWLKITFTQIIYVSQSKWRICQSIASKHCHNCQKHHCVTVCCGPFLFEKWPPLKSLQRFWEFSLMLFWAAQAI